MDRIGILFLGSSPSTLEIGLYLSPEYRYVNSEIRPHYLFFFGSFLSFILFRSYAACFVSTRPEARTSIRERFRFTRQDKTRHSSLTKKGYNGIMEVCNVYKLQGYFYTIGMNNLTTNNPPSRCS